MVNVSAGGVCITFWGIVFFLLTLNDKATYVTNNTLFSLLTVYFVTLLTTQLFKKKLSCIKYIFIQKNKY